MNLRLLAPEIQEEILELPRIDKGRDFRTLTELQAIALQPDWSEQRNSFLRKVRF
jgi:hypothetical protein